MSVDQMYADALRDLDAARGQRDEAMAQVAALTAELERARGARLMSVVFGHHDGAPRPFALQRKDRSLVALGAEFPDGAVALRLADDGGWTKKSDGGAGAVAAGGDLEILWLSDELESLAEMEQQLDAANARLVEEQEAHAATLRHLGVAEDTVERLVAELAEANGKIGRLRWSAIYRGSGRCRRCAGKENEHQMRCRHYVGPLEHQMRLRGINGSFGGWDYDCTCGQSARVGGLAGIEGLKPGELPPCPKADETWRGPAVDGLTADGAGTPEGSDGG